MGFGEGGRGQGGNYLAPSSNLPRLEAGATIYGARGVPYFFRRWIEAKGGMRGAFPRYALMEKLSLRITIIDHFKGAIIIWEN